MGFTKFRYLVCFATWFSLIVFYILRSNINVAILSMVSTKNSSATNVSVDNDKSQDGKYVWSDIMIGQVLAGFFYGYASTHFIGALLSAKYGPRKFMTICLLGSTLVTFATPFVTKMSVYFLIICRVMVGVFSGGLYPMIQEILGMWTPISERTILSSLTHSGNVFGIIINYGVGGFLCSQEFDPYGWNYFFYFSGSAGLLATVFWLIFGYDSPRKHACISDEEINLINSDSNSKKSLIKDTPWKYIFTSGPVWAVTCSHAGSLFIFYSLVTGHAKFLKDVFHVSTKKASLLSTMPFISNFLFQLIIPPIVDYLRVKRNYNITKIRKAVSGIAFVMGPALLISVGFLNTSNIIYVVCIMTIALSFIGMNVSGYMTAAIDIAPAYAGIIMGIMNTFGSMAGFINSTIAGILVNKYSENKLIGWKYTFIITGVVAFILGMVFVLFGSSEPQPWSNYKSLKYSVNEETTRLIRKTIEDDEYDKEANIV